MSTTTTTTAPPSTTSSYTLKASSNIPSGPVTATLNYYKAPEDGSIPYNIIGGETAGDLARNYGDESHDVTISDLRGQESQFNLDKNAFQVVQATDSPTVDFNSEESIKSTYYAEVSQLLLDTLPGAKSIEIFDHTIRRAQKDANRTPVNRTHIDQTRKATIDRVKLHRPDEAEELLKGRYRIVNVWRPLNGAVESSPLAVADSSTLPEDHLIPIEHRYPHRTGEVAGIKYHPDTKWYYFSGIRNDERLFLQCYDSELGARVPHSAFVDPRNGPDSKPRESIEVRALIFG